MKDCCDEKETGEAAGPCAGPNVTSCSTATTEAGAADGPCTWFGNMIQNCLQYATTAKQDGRGIVGIMCEYTPRELIMAAGAVPICLCGGSEKTISAAEEHLPANLCPLIKSTFGYHVQKSNPFLEMADLVVAETTCDGKKKMYELMAESRPMYVLELPQKPDDPEAFQHWLQELEKFRSFLQQHFNTEVTDAKIRDAIGLMNRERELRRTLAEFMTGNCPPLTGRELLEFKSSISGIPADFEQYEKAIEILQAKGSTCDDATSIRVLMTGVPMAHGAERVLDIIENSGGLVVCMESCTGVKPILEDVDEMAGDPIRAIAEKYFHLPCSVMTRNDRRLETLRQMAEKYRPECVIELIWQACITYDVESSRIRRLVEDELGIPYLRIETDYSPSDSARIGVRVEALLETVRSRHRGSMRRLMNTIAYCNPFVPPEWIAAHGMRPRWMRLSPLDSPLHGNGRALCPYAGAVIDQSLSGMQMSAMVLTTTCDQMRYAAGLIQSSGDVPVFLLNVPSTWQTDTQQRLYSDELKRLGRFLVRLGGRSPSNRDLKSVMVRYDDARRDLRATRSRLTAKQFARTVARLRGADDGNEYCQRGETCHDNGPGSERGRTERKTQTAARCPPHIRELRASPSAVTECSHRPTAIPVALVGGPLPEEDYAVLDLIEKSGGRVVLDATEGGERTLPASFDRGRLHEDPLGELARAYFGTIPDVFRRPNDGFYQWLGHEVAARQVRGIVLRRYVWCDLWHAELSRLKQWSPVPVSEIDVCDGEDSLGRSTGRIEAFLEILKKEWTGVVSAEHAHGVAAG